MYTALASYFDARANQGKWLLRIDDIDTARNDPGSIKHIISTLESFGLEWDDPIYYQSNHLDDYRDHLEMLTSKQLTYPCTCSRKSLSQLKNQKNNPEHYPGICRYRKFPEQSPYAIRFRVDSESVEINDEIQGIQMETPSHVHGDFIIKRKDQIFAYQFSVVIDDFLQNITHIVRGMDLLESTARQIVLQKNLEFPQQKYKHIPLITDALGDKLSKQSFAKAVDKTQPRTTLYKLLILLEQYPPKDLLDCSVADIIKWGIANWNPLALTKIKNICPEQIYLDYLRREY